MRVVVAFIHAARNPDNGLRETAQRVKHRIHVGGLGVVDKCNALNVSYFFQAVRRVCKGLQAVFNQLFRNAQNAAGLDGTQRIESVVLSRQLDFRRSETHRSALPNRADLRIVSIRDVGRFTDVFANVIGYQNRNCLGNKVLRGTGFLRNPIRHGFVGRVVNEKIHSGLCLDDAELGGHVILKPVRVPVQVVGRDVGEDGDVRMEVVTIIQLETADFQHVPVIFVFNHEFGEAFAHVARQPHVQPGGLQQMVREQRGGGFAIGAGDGNDLGAGMARRKFDFGNDRNAAGLQFLDDFGFVRYARTFHHFGGIQNLRFGVGFFLKQYVFGEQNLPVVLLQFRLVGQKHVETFGFGQQGRTHAAFATTQHNDFVWIHRK